MASEYLKWKYLDVHPEQTVELTPRQRRANWWYYHKWHVLLGVGLLALGVYLGARVLGIGQVLPDYQVAYVASAALPEDTGSFADISDSAAESMQGSPTIPSVPRTRQSFEISITFIGLPRFRVPRNARAVKTRVYAIHRLLYNKTPINVKYYANSLRAFFAHFTEKGRGKGGRRPP